MRLKHLHLTKRALPILFFTLLLDTISIGILIPILPIIFTDASSPHFLLGAYSVRSQYFLSGAIVALYGFMQFLASPILGELSDAYGRKRLLTLGVALLAVSNLMFGFGISIASVAVLLISRMVAGLAGANFSIAQATIADVSSKEDRAKNFGLIGAAFGIGFILGPLLGGLITSIFGNPESAFWFAGFLGVINVAFISIFLPETRPMNLRTKSAFDIWKGFRNIKAAFKDVDAAPVYLTSFLYMCGFAFFTSFVGVLLSARYDFSEAEVGTYFAIFGLCIALTQIFILRILTKIYKEKQILRVAFPIVALCIFSLPLVPFVPFLYVIIPIMAIPQGLSFANITSLVSKSVSADKQGAALGINSSLMALAQGFVPLVAGISSGVIGLTAPFVAGAIFMFGAWFVLRRV